jgi:dTMP kinase
VVFEGIEGGGKSTQTEGLARRLREAGTPVTMVREPGSTPVGEEISRLVKRGGTLSPVSELFLFSAARSELVTSVIAPALGRGDLVICDRFTDSTLAYQGHGRGLDLRLIQEINAVATNGLVPALKVLLDLDPGDGLGRKASDTFDRFEREAQEFHLRVRDGYLKIASADPERWLVLDARASKEAVGAQVWQRVSALIQTGKTSTEARP